MVNGKRTFIIEGDGRIQGVQVGDAVIWDNRAYTVKGDGHLWLDPKQAELARQYAAGRGW